MRQALLFIMIFLSVLIITPLIYAASSSSSSAPVEPTPSNRFTTCDACGFCPEVVNGPNPTCAPDPTGGPVPGNWKTCVQCLYPGLYPTSTVPDPSDCRTLLIDKDTNLAPTAYVGRQYTMIGCLTSNGGFENNKGTGASSFVQALFDLLVFRITGGIAFLYLMYGAFLVLTSQADPERLNYGKRVIVGAIVGLIFALSSVFIVNLIGSGILRLPGFTGTSPAPTP